jgi:hypothetical protein
MITGMIISSTGFVAVLVKVDGLSSAAWNY